MVNFHTISDPRDQQLPVEEGVGREQQSSEFCGVLRMTWEQPGLETSIEVMSRRHSCRLLRVTLLVEL